MKKYKGDRREMGKKGIILLTVVLACSFMFAGCGGGDKKAATPAPAGGKKLIIYTSMKESLIAGSSTGLRRRIQASRWIISPPAPAS
jgi:iron(III) transport system substrate-binding protein